MTTNWFIDSWVLFTVFAAFMQSVRTAGQKQLTSSLTPLSSTLVRYVFGWPFTVLYLYMVATDEVYLVVIDALANHRFLVFCVLASCAQIIATFLLVKTFTFRNFAVGTSFAKTEAVQTATISTLFFGSALSSIGWLAVIVGFLGILVVSMPQRKMRWEPMSILFGTLSGTAFALTSLWLREASLSLGLGVLQSAAMTLFAMVSLQSVICTVLSITLEPGQLALVAKRKTLAVFVGATSAAGSVGWFTAMTYQNPALVKSLGQVEFIFTLMITTLFFKETITRREYVGVAAIAVSVLLLLLPLRTI